MIYRRHRKLGEAFGAEGVLGYFALASQSSTVLEAVKAAKFGGDTAAAAVVKAALERAVEHYFKGFAVTVPRGRGKESFMYRTFRTHPRFLACFHYGRPVNVSHHWAARLGSYPAIPVALPVEELRGRDIVLLDDLVTTGTTMAHHLLALLRAGANATALALGT